MSSKTKQIQAIFITIHYVLKNQGYETLEEYDLVYDQSKPVDVPYTYATSESLIDRLTLYTVTDVWKSLKDIEDGNNYYYYMFGNIQQIIKAADALHFIKPRSFGFKDAIKRINHIIKILS